MNRTFKVVFNKARGVLTVVNEATKSVQKAGTKTVAASAVILAMATPALAEDIEYPQSQGLSGYSTTSAGQKTMEFKKGDVLKMTITGKDNTRAYGLLASGEGTVYTNMGTIQTNLAKKEDATQAWRVKGMMADNGGKSVNEGLIEVTNAYGMTVGSTGKNTLENKGTITVNGGVAMEVAPTGVAGTSAGSGAVASNSGTITVTEGVGILMAGQGGAFTNTGLINAEGGNAIYVQAESDKTTSGNAITLATGSQIRGGIAIAAGVQSTTLKIEEGADFKGRVSVDKSASGTTLTGTLNVSGVNSADLGGVVYFLDSKDSKIDLTNSNFTNNTAKGQAAYGGAVYTYANSFVQKGGSYVGNQAVSEGQNIPSNGKYAEGAWGGALMIKGISPVTFTDVLFQNNAASATKTETTSGGIAYGGAILADYSTGNNGDTAGSADLIFNVSAGKSLAYTGNTVSSENEGTYFDTFGYHTNTAAAGGFLFLDRGASALFDVGDNATLTIGVAVTADDTDSIASSIPNAETPTNGGKHALVKKQGNGTLVVNSSLNKYYGDLQVNGGRMQVNSKWNIKNRVTIEGGTLALANIAFDDEAHKKDNQVNLGKITVTSGGLETASGQVFQMAVSTDTGLSSTSGDFKFTSQQISIASGGSLVLNDAQYLLDYAKAAQSALSKVNTADGKLVMLGQIVDENGETPAEVKINDIASVSGDTVLAGTTVTTENQNLTVGTGAAGEASRADSLGVAALELGEGSKLTVTGGKEVTLVGTGAGKDLVSSNADTLAVDLNRGVLNLGTDAVSNGGKLNAEVTVDGTSIVNAAGAAQYEVTKIALGADGSALNVTDGATLTVGKLTGSGDVSVGNAKSAGTAVLKDITGFTGMIFADPDWNTDDSLNTVGNASHVEVGQFGVSLTSQLVAGRNSVVSVGVSGAEADAAFEKIASVNGLSWKNDVTAMAYLSAPVALGTSTGFIQVDGSLTEAPATYTGGLVTVASKGMLAVNQAAAVEGVAYIGGKVTLAQGSYLGLVNAKEGSFVLADSTNLTDNGAQVVTDNPFITGSLNAASGTVTTAIDTESGLQSIASLGMQAVTRRADSVLAATIADRTSFGQDLKPGMNLWVDVAGENYQMDDMDNGGEFEADIGYGTFGADMAVGQFTVGGALQYGTGSLRSSVSGIKNSIDNYAVSLYGTYSVTDAFRLGAELAYVWGENDITSSQAALNGSVDTEMYSAGIRAMYELKAGDFSFVPSIGLRVSQLSTDEMQVGTVRVEDQDQTLVQVPVALRISAGDFATQTGWALSPSFKIAYVPTFGDKEIAVGGAETDVIDTSPVQMDFGLFAGKDNLLVNAAFSVGTGKEGSSSVGGKIGLKYAF